MTTTTTYATCTCLLKAEKCVGLCGGLSQIPTNSLSVLTFIELGNALYNEGVGIPITKYQSNERLYCIQLWAITEIKKI